MPLLACFGLFQLQKMSESHYFATKNECMEDGKVDRLLVSPIVFSSQLKSSYNKKQNYVNDDLEVEWVEEYKRGVFITFTILSTGKKGIKQVNFR